MMRTTNLVLSLAASVMLISCTQAGAESAPVPLTEKQAKLLDKALKGKVAGEAVSCISTFGADNVIRVSDDLLLFRQSGRLVYQNRLRSACPGLARDDDVMVFEQFSGQKCRGDFIRLVDRVGGIPGPVCVLGDFVPYRKPPAS